MANWDGKYISPYAEHGKKSEQVKKITVSIPGQPLPTEADLMKERHDEIPENAKEIMRDLGIDPESWEY